MAKEKKRGDGEEIRAGGGERGQRFVSDGLIGGHFPRRTLTPLPRAWREQEEGVRPRETFLDLRLADVSLPRNRITLLIRGLTPDHTS